jgi:hypothetical protein
MFLAVGASGGGYSLSGPMHWRDIAEAARCGMAGVSFDFAGEPVDRIPAVLREMTSPELERYIAEASVHGVKVGGGWL